jgi:hypothetical protein
LPVLLPIGLAIRLTVHLAILLPVSLSVLLAIGLTIFPPIRLAILLPIRPSIFLTDIRLREYHVRHEGWDCHGHDQAGNRSDFQYSVLHDVCSFCARERMIRVSRGCYWTGRNRLSHPAACANQPVTQ